MADTGLWEPSDPTGSCLFVNGQGNQYEELTCLYPALKATHLNFELTFDPVGWHLYIKANPIVPIATCIFYLICIYLGKWYFSSREPVNWRFALGMWNLGLTLFSAWGAFRSWPAFYHLATNYSLKQFYCMDPESAYASGSTGLWMLLFVLSKFAELFDTMFIVVHKRKLIFLHVFHHTVILLCCWHSYATNDPAGIVVVAMNYTVHTVMYFYYFLMSMKIKHWMNPKVITFIQILQMFLGNVSTSLAAYQYFTTPTCFTRPRHLVIAIPLAIFFLYLFVSFFLKRYQVSAKPAKKDK
eukprot:CAMPEP_0118702610 /NCGR_PEP_ID=MMETSP0800-20121206/17992_1 /TAXON_ID=210618 ORGANISM="Striatella unipunctata, Strain CCMP2910" /NCGR_SAMPLE_ID=MMETSP0800 /ASSEMBLY_ACC=CAM_ASM_000638 /LENGTH=297 /DNA_ID=CAMNT_0006603841 /DNA_START=78 /DNA_END=971 /DNA_ORIENTATION=-